MENHICVCGHPEKKHVDYTDECFNEDCECGEFEEEEGELTEV